MDSSNRTNLIIGIVVGLVLGLLLGMLLFWVLFPVEWTDAHSYDLAPEHKAAYMALVADSFRLDKDPAQAEAYLEFWTPEEKEEVLKLASEAALKEGRDDKVQALNDLALSLDISQPTPEAPTVPEVESPVASTWDRFRVPCLVFILVLLTLVLGTIGVRALMNRQSPEEEEEQSEVQVVPAAPYVPEHVGVEQAPLGHFFTTYQLGEDTYDESFSIEAPTGEFLGECGMGISEILGDGEPDKVTAFEVWLFDKSDIRTVTKVLMSAYAYHDDTLRAKLAPKGEAVLAQPGSSIILETSGLEVQADITKLSYGEGEFPPESFFSTLVVELVANAKSPEAGASVF